jgi:hypothetical protein
VDERLVVDCRVGPVQPETADPATDERFAGRFDGTDLASGVSAFICIPIFDEYIGTRLKAADLFSPLMVLRIQHHTLLVSGEHGDGFGCLPSVSMSARRFNPNDLGSVVGQKTRCSHPGLMT